MEKRKKEVKEETKTCYMETSNTNMTSGMIEVNFKALHVDIVL